jgi:phosphatidylinositol glycan class B
MRRNRNICIYLVISTVYIVTAIYSNGYHHPDEHFQLIEFAGLKGGWNTGFDLAWEYDAQIRPALQPMVALCVFKSLNLFGISDPFLLSMALRLLTAALSLCCIGIFARSFSSAITSDYHTVFVILSYLLWFLPAVNVRFSSESWAGLMILPAISMIYPGKNSSIAGNAATGILLGLSFVFRFQMAIVIIGLFLWLIIIKKERIKNILYLLSGIILVIVAGTAIDTWFYGNFTFTPWNYFKINIIHDMASNFGTEPWFFYLQAILTRPTLFIGVPIVISLTVLSVYDYKNIVLWCLAPFLLMHTLIPHKELRFIFPMLNFVPFILILAFQTLKKIGGKNFNIRFLVPVLIMAAIINTGGLVMMSFKPAKCGNVNMMKYISEHYDDTLNIYTIAYSNPYSEGTAKGLTARFYNNPKVELRQLSEILNTISQKNFSERDLIILQAGYSERRQVEALGFTVKTQSIPLWIEKMNYLYHAYPEAQTLLLYEIDNQHSPR